MTTATVIFLICHTIAAAVTCWYALCGLNAGTKQTPIATKVSFAGIAIGSFAAAIHPPEMDIGGMGSALIVAGIAVGFLSNRRKCVCLNCPARHGTRKPAPIDTSGLST